jgi:hypothetical protein
VENICTEFLPATYFNFSMGMLRPCRSQWPRGLRCGSTAARLLGLCVRIPLGAWMFVSCECCDRLVNRPEESYRVWCLKRVIVKPRKMRRPRPLRGCRAIGGGGKELSVRRHRTSIQKIGYISGMDNIQHTIKVRIYRIWVDFAFYNWSYCKMWSSRGTTVIRKVREIDMKEKKRK